jgi:hypothetical protein
LRGRNAPLLFLLSSPVSLPPPPFLSSPLLSSLLSSDLIRHFGIDVEFLELGLDSLGGLRTIHARRT